MMPSESVKDQLDDTAELVLNPGQNPMESEDSLEIEASTKEPMCFKTHFEDYMEMYADTETVANYFNAHQGWFCRCALPMKAEPLGINGYALTIGRFGAFGYEVEPKIGLELLPPENKVYYTRTVPVPNYIPPGYDVDYNAMMELLEIPTDQILLEGVSAITKVQWTLDLAVYIEFPKFIYKLSKSLLQKTGDGVIAQIVRQVSRSLTKKVQQDFHSSLGLPLPKKRKK